MNIRKSILLFTIATIAFGIQIQGQSQNEGDLISEGSNSWIFHTPDDGEGDLHIAPKVSGSWIWGNQTIFKSDGNITLSKGLDVPGIIQIFEASTNNNKSPGLVLRKYDDFVYDGKFINHYGFGFHDFKDNSSPLNGNNAYISGYFGIDLFTGGKNRLRINHRGNVGIGTANPDAKLTVKGKIHAEEVLVDLKVPADYVFQKYYTGASSLKESYKMPTLEEVEAFTKKNHHLPEIPSAKQLQTEGLHIKEMTVLLLQKVEELTLYTIEQEKQIKGLKKELSEIKN
jgi:hypothetical protein